MQACTYNTNQPNCARAAPEDTATDCVTHAGTEVRNRVGVNGEPFGDNAPGADGKALAVSTCIYTHL